MAEEEHVLSIIVSLLRFASTKPQPNRQRVLAKFSEDNFMKIDRLVDLLVVYTEREKRNAEALAQIRLVRSEAHWLCEARAGGNGGAGKAPRVCARPLTIIPAIATSLVASESE